MGRLWCALSTTVPGFCIGPLYTEGVVHTTEQETCTLCTCTLRVECHAHRCVCAMGFIYLGITHFSPEPLETPVASLRERRVQNRLIYCSIMHAVYVFWKVNTGSNWTLHSLSFLGPVFRIPSCHWNPLGPRSRTQIAVAANFWLARLRGKTCLPIGWNNAEISPKSG